MLIKRSNEYILSHFVTIILNELADGAENRIRYYILNVIRARMMKLPLKKSDSIGVTIGVWIANERPKIFYEGQEKIV